MPGMLWNEAPSCTSIFGTVYEPRNLICVSQFCSMRHDSSDAFPSISSSALLPAIAGSWMSQKSVVWLPVLRPPCRMIPCGSLALSPMSKPNHLSMTLLPGNIVFDSPCRLTTCVPGLRLKNLPVLMSLGSCSPPACGGEAGMRVGVIENSVKLLTFAAVLSVTMKFPKDRQNTPPLTASPVLNSCCAATAYSQLYGRLPHP